MSTDAAYRTFRELADAEESRFLDPDTGSVRSEFASNAEQCLACSTNLPSESSQGYVACPNCSSLHSSPRMRREVLPELWKKDGPASFFHTSVYQAAQEKRKQSMHPRVEALAERLSEGRVLEIGCSIGLFLELLSERGYQVEGVEVLPSCIAECKKKGFTLHTEPIDELSLPVSRFDAVVTWEVIAHVADPAAMLAKAYETLQPGGLLYISTPNATALEYSPIWSDDLRHHPNLKPHVFLQIFSLEGMQTLLERSGFSVLEMSTPGTMDVESIRRIALEGNHSLLDSELQQMLLEGSDTERAKFQKQLASSNSSGHAFFIAEKR